MRSGWRPRTERLRAPVALGRAHRPLSRADARQPSAPVRAGERVRRSEVEAAEVDLLTPTPVATGGAAAPMLEFDEVTGEIEISDADIVDPGELPEPDAPAAAPVSVGFERRGTNGCKPMKLLPADLITRHHYLKKQAEIWGARRPRQRPGLDTLERAFVLKTSDDSVRTDMERLAREGERWDHVCEIYLRAAEREARPRR